MTATVGVNSYVTEAEATAYFADRFGFDLWTPSTQKDAALVSARQILDAYCSWYGDPVSDTQPLAFPRTPDADPVPQDIKDSQCEIAYKIIETGSTSQSADDPLTALKAGAVELNFKASKKGNPLMSALVDSLLLPYGFCKGSGTTTFLAIERC
jgi:hypothetical protein